LRQLLGWTTAIAILLAMARWIARGETADNVYSGTQEMVLSSTCDIYLAALSLPTVLACIGLVLADGRRTKFAVWAVLTAVAAPAIYFPTAFFLIEYFVARQGGSFPSVVALAVSTGWFEVGFFGVLLGSLIVLRLCGYRLKRGRIAPAPLSQPCGRTCVAEMAMAEGDAVVQDQPLANSACFVGLVTALTLAILALGWPAWTIYWAKRQPEIDRAIEEEWRELGASATVQSGKLMSLVLPEDPQNAAAAFKKLRQSGASVAVRSLILHGPPLTEDDVQYLNSLNSLKDLQLHGPAIADTEVKRLGALRGIEQLSLCDTRVTDDGLKSLMGLDDLEFLDVSGSRITDAGLEHLAERKGLRWLFLSNTQVTDRGLESLKGLKNLEHLDLLGTRITDAGLQYVGELKKLDSLELSRSLVTDKGVPIWSALADFAEGEWITWSDHGIMTREHVTPRGPHITDAGLRHLRGLSRLRSLGLSYTAVTDAGVRTIQEFASLASLNLAGTRITDAALTGLGKLKLLQLLNLRKTAVTNRGLAGFRQAVPGCSIETTTKGPSVIVRGRKGDRR
jgi:hypothetical protein